MLPRIIRCVRPFVVIGAALVTLRGHASAEIIYATTGTNLVWFDTNSPGTVHSVGPTAGVGGGRLAYNPNDNLFYTLGTTQTGERRLYSISPATGTQTSVALLAAGTFFEGLEWVGSRNSLVVTHGSTQATSSISMLSTTGALTPLTSNARDNDYAVWDSLNDRFYVSDPNGVAQLVLTDLNSGTNQNLGAVSWGDAAYSAADNCIYAVQWNTSNLLRIQTTGGLSPITVTNLGAIGGDAPLGLAIIPAPGASTLAVVAALIASRRRRDRN